MMSPLGHRARRSILWGAVFFLFVPLPAMAQLQTTVAPTMPALPPEAKSGVDPDAIYCRPPQAQTESRMLGPRVCKKNREWDALHAQGLDISADGRSTVASEKYRSVHRSACQGAQDSCF
jgi:hypothetical protein